MTRQQIQSTFRRLESTSNLGHHNTDRMLFRDNPDSDGTEEWHPDYVVHRDQDDVLLPDTIE